MDEFVLDHMVLYCKHWYKRSDEMWKDLRRCMRVDSIYAPETKSDVAYVMLQICSEFADRIWHGSLFNNVADFHNNVMERFTQNTCLGVYGREDYDYNDAVIDLCRIALEFTSNDAFDRILRPSGKVLPLERHTGETRQGRNQYIDKVFRGAIPYVPNNQTKCNHSKSNFDYFTKFITLQDVIKDGKLSYKMVNAERKVCKRV